MKLYTQINTNPQKPRYEVSICGTIFEDVVRFSHEFSCAHHPANDAVIDRMYTGIIHEFRKLGVMFAANMTYQIKEELRENLCSIIQWPSSFDETRVS